MRRSSRHRSVTAVAGLAIVFFAALVMSLVAAGASWLRGGRYVHEELDQPAPAAARG